MQYKFNGEVIKQKYIDKATRHFIRLHKKCIKYCVDYSEEPIKLKKKQFFVNDKPRYIKQCKSLIKILKKEVNPSFSFLQYAYYRQTGKSIAFLPKRNLRYDKT